jgi:uncharacterized membrane protein YhaH (DUF805 family)
LDLLLSSSATWLAMVAVVTVLFSLAARVPERQAIALDGLAALLAGGVCSANFWRCRHAHCVVTGGGWLALSVVAFAGAASGHSLIGGWEQLVFLAILVVSLIVEAAWYLARGTNAIGAAPAAANAGKGRELADRTANDLQRPRR